MTQQEITENNILLAEFIGYIDNGCSEDGFLIDPNTNYDIEIENLKFHSDWNWLMEVVDKIENLEWKNEKDVFKVVIDYYSVIIYNMVDNLDVVVSSNSSSKLKATYNACIKFVKWFNSQNK